jgi:hypothetical protein
LVNAVHIVYTPRDAVFLSSTHTITIADEHHIFDDLVEKVDVERYLNIPDSLNLIPSAQVLPNLQRATVGLWCRDGLDGNSAFGLPLYSNGEDHWDFQEHLANEMYQFTPSIVCRTAFDAAGVLDVYPTATCGIAISILHEPFESHIEPGLVPGAKNIIHVDINGNPHGFVRWMIWNYETVIDKMPEWVREFNVSLEIIQDTEVTFVVHHPFKSVYDKGDQAKIRWYQDIQAHEVEVRTFFVNRPQPAAVALGSWDRWKLLPEEEFPCCPACQPEEFKKHQKRLSVSTATSST